jgi:uncharacterized membrane protein YfcA
MDKSMSIALILGLILIGLLAGILSSMVGIGGGIVIVPCLVLFFGFSQHLAQGTTLAMLAIPVSIAGAYSYYQKGMVDIKVAMILAIGFVVGGYFGGKVAVNVPPLLIKKIFAFILILIAIKFLFIDKK